MHKRTKGSLQIYYYFKGQNVFLGGEMKKIVALILTIAIVCTCLFALTACNNVCEHIDENGDCKCDKCGAQLQHVDADGDGICDKCGSPAESKIEVDASLIGTYDITMWVSETVKRADPDDENSQVLDSVVEMTKRQVARFCEETGITINATIAGVTEADAGSKVVADVASAPDIYCFAQDQLARLVQASALAAPGTKAQEYISNINDAGAVGAAKVAGTLYAYPMTSDNGYFLYYDTSVVSNPESLEDIIEACNNSGKKFRFALENAWYNASFFFATECHSTWTTNEDGKFTSVDDNFNSDNGLIAMKGMQKLAQAECYESNADIFTDCAAIVTGTWNSKTAKQYFGENFGVTDLPSFTVDGISYHLGSYSGNKLMGVKPQTDLKRAAVLQLLAQYLTSDECQMERFEVFGWGPSSKISQTNEAVVADPSLGALVKQNEYAIPQPQIHGSWWEIAQVLGAEAKAAKSDADLQTALDSYDKAIAALFKKSEEELRAFAVIGNVGGTNWDADLKMIEDPEGTWTSESVFELKVGEGFKIRQGGSWDVQFAYSSASAEAKEFLETNNDGNCVVTKEVKCKIQLVYNETDGTGVINLIVVE